MKIFENLADLSDVKALSILSINEFELFLNVIDNILGSDYLLPELFLQNFSEFLNGNLTIIVSIELLK